MSYIGQEVVCVEGINYQGYTLIEGETYTIHQISGCKCEPAFDVGKKLPGIYTYTECIKCNMRVGGSGEWFHRASRFIPLEEYQKHETAVEELLKEKTIAK